ncbi:site-specific integrase [Parabacteroides gordonii]|uniref:Core-binding (CB) domain-containing protein n=1 Tax=Parabacteroides gordonii MS-1 = DSM 23371 TaxID=1203610 RepID=A0A0F5JDP2_9BACT|nr:site-specific integrase [Parabacteroides gordonii]KKB55894.1 hypothetical protein HMPREF1536_03370 [Parabacteroides gordonii MS-1 = DSM 23371]MCA5581324.1 site-specific integrase [Parabacteroides gordonii]
MTTVKTRKGKHLLLTECIRRRVESKRSMGKDSTADLYQAAGHRFLEFLGEKDIYLSEITPTQVSDFQGYLQAKNLRINTINSYTSSLRAIFNSVLNDHPFKMGKHPFLHLKLKRDVTVRQPLTSAGIEKIATTDFSHDPRLAFRADLSLFSFMAFGMPFVDMIHLKKSNIQGRDIVYNRHKTGIQIRMQITPGMWHIIRKYRNDGEYLFPVMSKPVTHSQYKGMLAAYNKALKTIGKLLKIHPNLTSYVMRRSWAAEAQRRHVSVSVIGKGMGHTSEKTTRYYLGQLDQSELNKANRAITKSINLLLVKNVKGGTGKSAYL